MAETSITPSLALSLAGDVATVRLTRPEVHNALDEALVGNLAQAFQKLSVTEAVRVVVLEAEGKSFCAGGDIGWMRRAAELPPDDNRRDAMQWAVMLDAVERCAKPVVAMVQGAALGGGVGLIAACDVVIASDEATFALSEVRLGLIPAVIGPYLAAAMGVRACRRYVLTGERFDAREAFRLGLVHAVVTSDRLGDARDRMVEALRRGGPKAQGDAKELLRVLADTPPGPDLMRWTTARLSEIRCGDEAREGLAAFVEKRKPGWGG
jgi:methylglutaconyl-CoA hydratase